MEDRNIGKLSAELVVNAENFKKELTGLSVMFKKIAEAIDEYVGGNTVKINDIDSLDKYIGSIGKSN